MKIGRALRKWNIKMLVVGQNEIVIGQLWQLEDFFLFSPTNKFGWSRSETNENKKDVLEAVKDRYKHKMKRIEGEEGEIKFTMSQEELCF